MRLFGLLGRKTPKERLEPPLDHVVIPASTSVKVAEEQLFGEQAAPVVASINRNPYGSNPAAGLRPEQLATILRSSIDIDPRLYLDLAEDMEERLPQYGSVLSTRKRAVARMEITVTPAGEDPADKAEADLVRAIVEAAPFRAVLIDLLDALGKGFSAVEMIWDTSQKPWRPVQFKHRPPRFFQFDRTDPDRLVLRGDSGPEDLWPNCWLVHRAKAKSGLAIRGGLARQVAWLFMFQTFNTRDWAIFAEAYGQPMRVGKFNAGASEGDKRVLLEALRAISTDYAAIIPASMEIEFLKAELQGTTDLYERRADWLDRQVSKIVLGQTGTTDSQAGSGYAQAKVHDDVREDIADSDAEQLAVTLTEGLVQPLVDLNFAPRKRNGYPRLTIGHPEVQDVAALVTNVARLIPFGLKVSMAEMQSKIGVTPPAEDDELLVQRVAAAPAQPAASGPETSVPAANRLDQLDAIQSSIEDMIGDGGWEPLLSPIVDQVSQSLRTAKSADEAKSILAEAFSGLDTSALAELLARAMFASRLAGTLDEDI